MSESLKLQVIACGVFERELEEVCRHSQNEVDVRLLDAGLHAAPDRLRLRAQEAIDCSSGKGYDAVCFAYGLCGRGTTGLIARDVPLVLPRVHDCISIFLGSAQAYREQFSRRPGTFYFTTGWYDKKAHPDRMRLAAAREFEPRTHPHYDDFAEQYGEENAHFIIEFLESWRRNYRRAALIDHGFATPEHEELTETVARAAGWEYEKLQGSLRLLQDLVDGNWDQARYLVAAPGETVVATNDRRVLAAAPGGEGRAAPRAAAPLVEEGTFTYGDPGHEQQPHSGVALGIDAGGTYTDAVLYDLGRRKVLSKAKAQTTHGDLARGVSEALGGLDSSLWPRVEYVCLSTTLATNAIVEGRGRPVGLLLMPYDPGLVTRIRTPLRRCLGARIGIEGVEEEPVDEEEVRRAARELVREGAEAFAVSGYAAVRNPAHETAVRDMLREEFDLPVVCGHELTGKLNFVTRAHTAVLNARLIPAIDHLLEAAGQVLADAGLRAPLFVVRGDGTLIRAEAARRRAVETVLSGPAASAVGGLVLTGLRDAMVVDVGGTTTDTVGLEDGIVAVREEGASVGDWRTSVEAADIQTTGLGGDSAVRPDERGGLRIGPDRVLPLCRLARDYPALREELKRMAEAVAADDLRMPEFLTLVEGAEDAAAGGREGDIIEVLARGPRTRSALSDACGCQDPALLPLRRLERIGAIRRAGPTPTDALHVLGEFGTYDVEAARLGMRALGRFLRLPEQETALRVRRETERLLALALMRAELADGRADCPADLFERARGLLEMAVDGTDGRHFRIAWQQKRPVVGIGAPVGAFLPGACRLLGAEPVIPDDAEVANAVGAALSKVVARTTARIRPTETGSYVLHAADLRKEYGDLRPAVAAAREHVVDLVRARAVEFGSSERQVRVAVKRRTGRLQDGSEKMLEVVVHGTLEGAPDSG